ncbi:MAG: hypothetical protein JNM33_07410 [Rubrivivax sp.]|nr:hypothetical protein [Rubrivivax sp.]
MDIGRESAAAGLRMDKRAPDAYREAFIEYRGPTRALTYFEVKVLSLRLSAVHRGMLVDRTVTAQLLERIANGRCPVTHEQLRFGGGQSPRNASVDRLVNEVSYRAGNICLLSQRANRAKAEHTFEEVAQLAQSGEHQGGLAPVEWMRLASLMYGAWARAYKQADPYLLPLAAVPGPGMFMSTSQVAQSLLMRHFSPGGPAEVATHLWLDMTRQAQCEPSAFLVLRDSLANALTQERHAGNAWLHSVVFDAFVDWYCACRHVVAPAVEALLNKRQQSAGDSVADLDWPTTSRYQH